MLSAVDVPFGINVSAWSHAVVQHVALEFVSQFPSLRSAGAQALLPPPHDPATFERCKLQWHERDAHSTVLQLHTDLLTLRAHDVAFSRQEPGAVDGAVIGEHAFVLRFAAQDFADERVLIVNFGADLTAPAFPEPLMAPPDKCDWQVRWSSEHPDYGGVGTYEIATRDGWRIPGQSATVLAPVEITHART